ncbi:hypothetical protein [Paenibacillus xylanexedens]|uniref:hypothetical protein n=1 Tax=Paenibacillus xylanexedens TaxID=528191 RepID=UPI00119ED7AD|nr:hypothetical protein [Paenibacillus xylanexedens]
MLLSIAVVLVGCLIAGLDVPNLIRRKEWKEIAVYSVLLLIGTASAVIAVNLWDFPSPLYIIIWIYKPINQLLAHIAGN